jgi:hypothetical protein
VTQRPLPDLHCPLLPLPALPSFPPTSLQGIVGSMPWNALVFNTLYLQLLGFSDFQSSLVAALFLAGSAFGAQAGHTAGVQAATAQQCHLLSDVALARWDPVLSFPRSPATVLCCAAGRLHW